VFIYGLAAKATCATKNSLSQLKYILLNILFLSLQLLQDNLYLGRLRTYYISQRWLGGISKSAYLFWSNIANVSAWTAFYSQRAIGLVGRRTLYYGGIIDCPTIVYLWGPLPHRMPGLGFGYPTWSPLGGKVCQTA